MAKRGAKPKLGDPKLRKKLLDAISLGMSRNKAADFCRIACNTIGNYAKRNKTFEVDLKEAEAKYEEFWLKFGRLDPKNVIASATMLGRKNIEDWGRWRDMPKYQPAAITDGSEFVEINPAMEAAEVPPGAIPSMVPPGPVQDDSRGTAQREDGAVREAQASPVAVELPNPSAAVAKP